MALLMVPLMAPECGNLPQMAQNGWPETLAPQQNTIIYPFISLITPTPRRHLLSQIHNSKLQFSNFTA